jgi:hypothetical protein
VLADVLSRDGAELSASQTRSRNLANADHLAVLHAIWAADTRNARHDRYRQLVTAALPPLSLGPADGPDVRQSSPRRAVFRSPSLSPRRPA